MSHNDNVSSPVASEHLLGRVKWFNNKAGYGFITVTDGTRSGSDIFVHHSAVDVENQQYKYLVQGEYVEFDLIRTESEKHEWQASHVCGIRGGKLMCETRRELKLARNEYKTVRNNDEQEQQETKMPRQKKTTSPRVRGEGPRSRGEGPRSRGEGPRSRGEGPRSSGEVSRDGDKKEWTLVGKNSNSSRKPRGPSVRTNVSKSGATIITIEAK